MLASSPSLPDIKEENESDTSGIEEDSKSEVTVDKDTVDDDGRPQPIYQFHNCTNVYWNAFNANGNQFTNAGNHNPQVTCMSS